MGGQVCVAREREMLQLNAFLSQALDARGLVCFVSGEAGSGKTTLVAEFCRHAWHDHKDLIVAVGQSDAQTGEGDSYLPFREVLGQLTGDFDARLTQDANTTDNADRLRKLLVLTGQALVEVGPDLIGILVPGASLLARMGTFAAEKAGWLTQLERLAKRPRDRDSVGPAGIEQSHIFEQYTNVLIRLAEKQPLMLVLDDLQWADPASIGLLFRLGRRISSSRILIVGTYRAEEVALGRRGERHPLEKVLAEFKRYFGDIRVDLDLVQQAEGQRFVDAYLETEPNRFGDRFKQALFHHTGGHPLFTVELLRDLQEEEVLIRDQQGCWVEGANLDWEALPARVEGVIEERIGRLEPELRRVLTVASVEGESFIAEVVAGVQAVTTRGLIQRLSGELEDKHRLVRAQGVQRVDGRSLSFYRFQHNLFQNYLYGALDEVERVHLHEDVGTVLETLYLDQADKVAVQLARHFEEAGLDEKARRYLRRAGEQAAARYANDEALRYLNRALELTPEDCDPEREADRYELLLAREMVHELNGARESQLEDLATLEELAAALNDDAKKTEVALRRARHSHLTNDYQAAVDFAQAAVNLAQITQDICDEAEGRRHWGTALMRQGNIEESKDQIGRAMTLARRAEFRQVEARCLGVLGILAKFQGDYAEATTYEVQALTIWRQIGDLRNESRMLNNLGISYAEQGDFTNAGTCFEQALVLDRKVGNRHAEGWLLANLARLAADLGDFTRAKDYYGQSLAIFRQVDQVDGEGLVLNNLASIANQESHDERSRDYAQQSLRIHQKLCNRIYEGDALTSLGHALQGLGNYGEAADAYQRALDIRRELGQPNQAMENLAGLAQVALAQGDLSPAQTYAEEILLHLEDGNLDGATDPFRVYLTCYRALRAISDARALAILTTAHNLLQERAGRIEEADKRRSFLENVTAHREIMREYAKHKEPQDSQ